MGNNSKIWFDPERFGWSVRSSGILLFSLTLAEYMRVIMLLLQEWMFPRSVWADFTGLAVLAAPFLASQFLVAVWLLVAVRLRRSSKQDEGHDLAVAIISRECSGSIFWRRPRLGLANVSQPKVVSIFGIPIMLLPPNATQLYRHYLGRDYEQAYEASILHEIAHVKLFDDVLFLPWQFTIVSSAGGAVLGVVRALGGEADLVIAVTHVLLVCVLAVLGFYIIRRREAFC